MSLRWLPTFDPGHPIANAAWSCAKGLMTFHLVCLGFVIFRAESVPQALALIAGLAGGPDPGIAAQWIAPLLALIVPLLAMQLAERLGRDPEAVLRWPYPARAAVYLVVMLAILVQGEDGGDPFIYFQF